MTPPDILASWEKEAETICNHLVYTNDANSRDYQDNKRILALCALVKAYREAVKERETGIDLALAMLRNFNSDASKKIIDEVLDKALSHQVDEERFLKGESNGNQS